MQILFCGAVAVSPNTRCQLEVMKHHNNNRIMQHKLFGVILLGYFQNLEIKKSVDLFLTAWLMLLS